MKFFAAVLLSVVTGFAATEFDLRKGIDFTGATNVTAAQMNQLVDAGLIASTNKGGILRRSGNGGGYWPDITANPRYTNFLWADLYTSPATLKTYVPTGDAYSNWVSIGASTVIAGASVGSAQLAANAVQTTNIANNAVTGAKINAGSIDNTHLQNGSVSNANLADLTIASGKLAYGAVLSTNIASGQLFATHFSTASVNSNALATPAVATTNLFDNSVVSNKIAANSIFNWHLTDQAVWTTNIRSGSITSNQVASQTFGTNVLTTNVTAGLVKCWGVFTNTAATATLLKGYNVATVARLGAGQVSITFGGTFTPANGFYCVTATSGMDVNNNVYCSYTNKLTTEITIRTTDSGGTLRDNNEISFHILDFP